jgi:methylated-DNA-[protein]-cysteine S-methyltransferase
MIYYAHFLSALGDMVLCSDGTHLTGLYFSDQKDSPQPSGSAAALDRTRRPADGMLDGFPLKLLRASKTKGDGPLFDKAGPPESNSRSHITAVISGPRSSAFQPIPLVSMQAGIPDAAIAVFEQTREELFEYFEGTRKTFTVPLRPEGTVFQQKIWRALLDIPFGEYVSYGDVAFSAGLSPQHGRPVGTAVGRNPITIIIPCHRVLSGTGRLTGYTGGLERKLALLKLEGLCLG